MRVVGWVPFCMIGRWTGFFRGGVGLPSNRTAKHEALIIVENPENVTLVSDLGREGHTRGRLSFTVTFQE